MRARLLVVAWLGLAAPLIAQNKIPDFMPQPDAPGESLKAYTEKPYRPIRIGEVQSAGFLTEGRVMAFGEALGPTSPQQVRSVGRAAVSAIGGKFAVAPPTGGSYRVGDTLVIADLLPAPRGWGMTVVPTGLVTVLSRNSRQTVTEVAAIYGAIRRGQVVLPLEFVSDPGEVTPVPSPGGPTGAVIGPLQPRELQMPGGLMLTDLGREDGMFLGDFVEIRRRPSPRANAADTIEETMATGQVIHVNSASSTIKLINILAPDITAGTPVVRVATLPR